MTKAPLPDADVLIVCAVSARNENDARREAGA
jgi:hypothetical protein